MFRVLHSKLLVLVLTLFVIGFIGFADVVSLDFIDSVDENGEKFYYFVLYESNDADRDYYNMDTIVRISNKPKIFRLNESYDLVDIWDCRLKDFEFTKKQAKIIVPILLKYKYVNVVGSELCEIFLIGKNRIYVRSWEFFEKTK